MSGSDAAIRRKLHFGLFAAAADITPENPNYQKSLERIKHLENDPKFKQAMKKRRQRASYLNTAYQLNGPSLFADVYVRNFLLEFNNRVFSGRGNEQPSSFNIMRSFVTPDEKTLALNLLEENFYQFNLLDYLDFVTGDGGDSRINCEEFDDLKIYELNSAGSFAQVVLPGFDDLVFCGAAIVREGSELSIMGVFGNTKSHFLEGGEVLPETISPARREFIGDGPWDETAEKLFESDDFYPLIALARIDGETQTIQAQYIMHESKSSFRVVTDDPTVFADIMSMDAKKGNETIQHSLSELAQYRHVFDLLYNLLQFPRFFEQREDDFRVERHPTKFRLKSSSLSIQKIRSALESQYCPNYRDVLTLAQTDDSPKASTLDKMDLRFETSGFWRTLPLDKVGADKHGNEVHGKTWVEQKLSWREADGSYQAQSDQTAVVQIAKADDVGFIYVMRSPIHEKNIFKIGYTKRNPEDRANDLSGTSGQPDALVVMQSWKVFEPFRVEQEIHTALSKERINARREFFKARFEMLRETIERVIREMNAKAP